LHCNRRVGPLGIASNKDGIGDVGEFVDQVLLDVGLAVFIAGNPRVHVDDGIVPGAERRAAMRKIVVLLDGAVQLLDRFGKPAGGKRREVVAEEQVAGSGAGRGFRRSGLRGDFSRGQRLQKFARQGRAGGSAGSVAKKRSAVHLPPSISEGCKGAVRGARESRHAGLGGLAEATAQAVSSRPAPARRRSCAGGGWPGGFSCAAAVTSA